MSRYLPYRSRNGRPPHAPMAYAISEPSVLPAVAATTTAQKLHPDLVKGSTAAASETRKPAKGRISSDGSGIMADSIVIAIITPKYPSSPYSHVRNGMTMVSMKASKGCWCRRAADQAWPVGGGKGGAG